MSNTIPKWDDTTPIDNVPKWDDTTPMDEPGLVEGAYNTFKDTLRGQQEGIPGYGLIQKAAAGTSAGISKLWDDRPFEEIYDENLKGDMAKDKLASDRSPIMNTAGNISGSFLAPGVKGGSVGSRIAGNAALSAADMGTRGEEIFDPETASKSGLLSGGISAGVEALPLAGKILKAGKKLIPGTEGAVTNKLVAVGSKLNPMNSATSDEVLELLDDVKGRRAARGVNVNKKTIEVANDLNNADVALKDKVGEIYNTLENEAMRGDVSPKDVRSITGFTDGLLADVKVLNQRPEMYSTDARKVLGRVASTLESGAIDELDKGLPWAGKKVSEIEDSMLSARAVKYRLLDARRELDDVMKNKNYDKLNKNDKAVIQKTRNNLNIKLKDELSDGDKLKAADDLYSGYKSVLDDTFDAVRRNDKIDPTRLRNNLNTELVKGQIFKDGVKKLEKFVAANADSLGKIPEVDSALKALNDLQAVAAAQSKMDIANRSVGGPTGQGINSVLQALVSYGTGGLSLLALPISNPAAYTQLIDGIAAAGDLKTAKQLKSIIDKGSRSILDKAPQFAVKAYELRDSKEPKDITSVAQRYKDRRQSK